jgi:uncharacterized protein (TIGR02266 family)
VTRSTSGLAQLVREFLGLERRRLRRSHDRSDTESARWNELRWLLEAALEGSGSRARRRRKALRVPSDLEVRCAHREREDRARAQCIAEGGLFLATESPPPVGTPLRLTLVGDGGETVEVAGAVVWVREPGQPGGTPGAGIEFEHLDESQREAVAYLVEEALEALAASGSLSQERSAETTNT